MATIFEKYISMLSEYFIINIHCFLPVKIKHWALIPERCKVHDRAPPQASEGGNAVDRTSSPDPAYAKHSVGHLSSTKQLRSRQAATANTSARWETSPSLAQCQRGYKEPRLWEGWCLPCRSHDTHVWWRAAQNTTWQAGFHLRLDRPEERLANRLTYPPCSFWSYPSALMPAPKHAQELKPSGTDDTVYYSVHARQYFQNKTKLDLK